MITEKVSKELEWAERDRQEMEEKYCYKFSDNRIDIRGKDLVVERDGCKMYMLPADDLRNFTFSYNNNVSYDMRYSYAAETALLNMTSSPLSACVVIEDNNKQIQAASWVWVDEKTDVLVFDDIEFRCDPEAQKYMNIIRDYVEAMPYQDIQMGFSWDNSNKFPFGRKCKEDECVSRPDNMYLNVEHCYSEYHPIKDGHINNMSPVFFKKDGKILEKAKSTNQIGELTEFLISMLTDAKNELTAMTNDGSEEAKELLKECDDLLKNKCVIETDLLSMPFYTLDKEAVDDFLIRYDKFKEEDKEL